MKLANAIKKIGPFWTLVYLILLVWNDGIAARSKNEIILGGFILIAVLLLIEAKFKRPVYLESLLFLFLSFLAFSFFIYNALYFLPETEISSYRSLIKLYYFFFLIAYVYQHKNYKNLIFLTIASHSPIIFFYYYRGFTPGELPLLIVVIAYCWYTSKCNWIVLPLSLLLLQYKYYFSVSSSLISVSMIMIFLTLYHVYSESKEISRKIYDQTLYFLLIVTQFILSAAILSEKNNSQDLSSKVNYLMINVNYHAAILVIWIPMVMHMLVISMTRKAQVFHGLVLAICLFNLSHLDARTANISLITSLTVYLFIVFTAKINQSIKKILILFLFALILVLGVYFYPMVVQVDSIAARIYLWKIYIKAIFDFALITGFGPGSSLVNISLPMQNLSSAPDDFKPIGAIHSHNVIIGVFHSFGFLGLIAALTLVVVIGVQILKKMQKGSDPIATSVITGFTIFSMLDYTIDIPFVAWSLVPIVFVFSEHRNSIVFTKIKQVWYERLNKSNKNKIFWKRLYRIIGWVGFSLIFFVSSIYTANFILFRNEAKLFKDRITLNVFEGIELDQSGYVEDEKYYRFKKLEYFSFINIFDYKKDQFEAEVYRLYYEKKKNGLFLEKSIEKYDACIKKNKFATYCYYRLSSALAIKGDKEKSAEAMVQANRLDPFNLLPDIYSSKSERKSAK